MVTLKLGELAAAITAIIERMESAGGAGVYESVITGSAILVIGLMTSTLSPNFLIAAMILIGQSLGARLVKLDKCTQAGKTY